MVGKLRTSSIRRHAGDPSGLSLGHVYCMRESSLDALLTNLPALLVLLLADPLGGCMS